MDVQLYVKARTGAFGLFHGQFAVPCVFNRCLALRGYRPVRVQSALVFVMVAQNVFQTVCKGTHSHVERSCIFCTTLEGANLWSSTVEVCSGFRPQGVHKTLTHSFRLCSCCTGNQCVPIPILRARGTVLGL